MVESDYGIECHTKRVIENEVRFILYHNIWDYTDPEILKEFSKKELLRIKNTLDNAYFYEADIGRYYRIQERCERLLLLMDDYKIIDKEKAKIVSTEDLVQFLSPDGTLTYLSDDTEFDRLPVKEGVFLY